jgi:folate-binding protein YgfZ
MHVLLDQPLAIQLSGVDAGKVFHNVTTNQVLNLIVGGSVETFVTDVRGWVVAHGLVFRADENQWWLLGQHPNPEKVAAHIDRYIIREDARVSDHSGSVLLSVFAPSGASSSTNENETQQRQIQRYSAPGMPVPFLAMGTDAVMNLQVDFSAESDDGLLPMIAWERLRISRLWPRFSQDIWEKCIPQELDRDARAISFTKGCYLGQETIARLDALGQIQKKLSLIRVPAVGVMPQAPITADGKAVGHVTSSVDLEDYSLCLAVLKRGFFNVSDRLSIGDLSGEVISPLGQQ